MNAIVLLFNTYLQIYNNKSVRQKPANHNKASDPLYEPKYDKTSLRCRYICVCSRCVHKHWIRYILYYICIYIYSYIQVIYGEFSRKVCNEIQYRGENTFLLLENVYKYLPTYVCVWCVNS